MTKHTAKITYNVAFIYNTCMLLRFKRFMTLLCFTFSYFQV